MSTQDNPSRVFGENLRKLRKEKRLTASDLASALCISAKTLDAYERGTRKPSLSILDDLQKEFGVAAWRWLIPNGASDETVGHLPSTVNEPSLVSLLFCRSELWADDVKHMAAAIPPHVIRERLSTLADQGLRPHMQQGIADLIEVAEQNGLTVQPISLPWEKDHRAAALSTEPTVVDRLFVNENAPKHEQREDMGQCLVAHLLGLRPQACHTRANSNTEVTVWHAAGRDMFGYSLDYEEWRNLRIDSFAHKPGRQSNPCFAEKAVRAKLSDNRTEEQKSADEYIQWPITRVERLYHKNGKDSFVCGITIKPTDGPEKTRLIVTVTDLQVPSLMVRLTRELLVPERKLQALIRAGGASIPWLARYACVREDTIRERMAETGIWSLVYEGMELESSLSSQERASTAPVLQASGPSG